MAGLRHALAQLGYTADSYQLTTDESRIMEWRGPGTPPTRAQLEAARAAFEASPAGAAESRRTAAASSLQGARAIVRTHLDEAQADHASLNALDLVGLRAVVRRMLLREIAALRRERAALFAARLDGDDGEA